MPRREKFLFSGSSHFQGIGLIVEKSKHYNDEDWLMENGMKSPITYTEENIKELHKIEKENRWSYLLCKKLNVEEINIRENPKYGSGGHNDLLINLKSKKIILDKDITNVFIEPNFTRWVSIDGETFTPAELIRYIENNKDSEEINQIGEFLKDTQNYNILDKFIADFKDVQSLYPNINFWVLTFNGEYGNYKIKNRLYENYINRISNYKSFVRYFSEKNKLIYQTSFAYKNPKWEVSYNDEHLGIDAQRELSDMIFNYLTNRNNLGFIEENLFL